MYLEHFGLEADPFRLSPDSKFYYPSLAHSTAKNYMDYVLWSRDSFIVITGDIGTGKTTLIQKMLDFIFADGQSARHTIDHTANGRAVAFSPGGYPEDMAEAVIRHDVSFLN